MKRLFLATTVVSLGVTAVFALWVTPPRADQGFDAVRLLYLHAPTAWIAYLAFGVTALASLLWLFPRTRSTTWDLLAGASAEVGVVFTGLTLVLGSLWGRPDVGNLVGVGRVSPPPRSSSSSTSAISPCAARERPPTSAGSGAPSPR